MIRNPEDSEGIMKQLNRYKIIRNSIQAGFVIIIMGIAAVLKYNSFQTYSVGIGFIFYLVLIHGASSIMNFINRRHKSSLNPGSV